jgi:hypothetical protein
MATVTQEQVEELLTGAAARHGMSIDDLRERGRRDELTDPELRDIWLIWGDGPVDAPDVD